MLLDACKAFRYRNYRYYTGMNIFFIFSHLIQGVALGWLLYAETNSTLVLGYIGLVQVIPVFFFALVAGYVADHVNRKRVLQISCIIQILCSGCFALLSVHKNMLLPIFFCLFLSASARTFYNPARFALLPSLVPEHVFNNAVVWSSNSFQIASVIAPALGGLLIAWQGNIAWIFLLDLILALVGYFCISKISFSEGKKKAEKLSLKALYDGIYYLHKAPILLSAMLLDMFAVLLGGATTLLPVFSKSILHVGPEGYGWLNAAPAIGALLMGIILSHLPPFKRPGRILLHSVTGFGLAMILFGFSRYYWLSLLALILSGALDNISVVIRSSLIQLRVPDALRGRVSAINNIFLGASNQLGGFESGLTAYWFGPVLSVTGGGVGTLIIVWIIGRAYPELKNMDRLESSTPRENISTA